MKRLLGFFFGLFLLLGVSAKPAAAQSPVTGGRCQAWATSCTITASVTSGQTACVGVNTDGSSSLTVTVADADNDAFWVAAGPLSAGGIMPIGEIYCSNLTHTNASEVFTITSSLKEDMGGELEVFSGTWVLDKNASATGNSTAASSGNTATTTSASELLVGYVDVRDGGYNVTAGTGWTAVAGGATGYSGLLEYQTVSSTGAYAATGTLATAYNWVALIATLAAPPPTAALPTLAPTGVTLGFTSPATPVTVTSSTTGATIVYTTDGSTPTADSNCNATHGTALTNGGTVNLSSAITLKAIACLSGLANSSFASGIYNLYPDQPIAGYASSNPENFGEYWNPILNVDQISSVPTQLPLDTAWTGGMLNGTQVSEWQAMNTSSGFYAYPAIDPLTGSYGIRGGSTFGYAVRTAEVYPANQFSKVYYHAPSGGTQQAGVAVGTNCTPGSSNLSGNILTAQANVTYGVSLFLNGNTTPAAYVAVAPAEGDVYEMRQFGTTCVPLKNGAQIPGFAASYTCNAATHPVCVGVISTPNLTSNQMGNAVGYNWTGGAVAVSNPGVTPVSWSGVTYSTFNSGALTSSSALQYPLWMPDGKASSGFPSVGLITGNVGNAYSTLYAYGSGGGAIKQAHYLAPFQNTYWFHITVAEDATNWSLPNYFVRFAGLPSIPPAAIDPSISTCYDSFSGYLGVEPEMQGGLNMGNSIEYGNTHKLHVTYDNEFTSTLVLATAQITGGSVTGVTIQNGANTQTAGGITSPNVKVYFWGGGGSGATATATLVSGTVTAITVTNGGSGYTSAPNITVVPASADGSQVACAVISNYNIRTAIGFEYAPMHGDEIVGTFNKTTGLLRVFAKSAATIPGWTANTTVTPRIITNGTPAGTTGTTIEVNGLYQVEVTPTWNATFSVNQNIAAGEYISDGSHWQKALSAGTIGKQQSPPAFNHSGGTTYDSYGGVTYQDMGAVGTPTTGATQPPVWGGTNNTCETDSTDGAMTVDGTAVWQCIGEAVGTNSFQFLGSVVVPGFNSGWTSGFPGIWSNGIGYSMMGIQFGSGDPCLNGTFTCTGGQEFIFTGWMQ